MSLLAILIALSIDRFWESVENIRRVRWFFGYRAWLQARLAQRSLWDGLIGLMLTLAPPLIVVGLLQAVLVGWLAFFGFIFAVFALVWALGPKDLEREVQAITAAWERGDDMTARLKAEAFLETPVPQDGATMATAVIDGVLIQALERMTAVLFWFVILGPFGAVLYRLTTSLRKEPTGYVAYDGAAVVLHGILNWVPARVTALGYAVTGNFVDALQGWRTGAVSLKPWWAGNSDVLVSAGRGALSLRAWLIAEPTVEGWANQIQAALALVWRTVIFWLIVLGVITLTYWAA